MPLSQVPPSGSKADSILLAQGPAPFSEGLTEMTMFDNFYGLAAKPFQSTPDPAFYFRSSAHRKALSHLAYGLAQREGFVMLTGEPGTGKSVVAAQLAETADADRLAVAHVTAGTLEAESLATAIGQAFGSVTGRQGLADRRLLIVDDAQNLSPATLEKLARFQSGTDPELQILLVGRPQLRATLQLHPALEPLRLRIVAAHHLGALEQAEIEPYVVHRLEAAGWYGHPQFDQRVFVELHEASGGIPRHVNRIANRLLLLGAVERRTRIDSGMMKVVRGGLAGEPAISSSEPLPRPSPEIDPKLIENLLAERDAQIAELQQAIVELSTQHDRSVTDAVRPEIAAMQEQFARIEARMIEQERTIRQTLTMLIEWIEAEAEPAKAA